jgi:hypothetical protein
VTAPDAPEWRITPEEADAVRTYLDEHFPGGKAIELTEPSDPGQLFSIRDREGTRYSLKILREVIDDLRAHRVPLAQFLAKHGIAHRMRHTRRVLLQAARGEDMVREERLD